MILKPVADRIQIVCRDAIGSAKFLRREPVVVLRRGGIILRLVEGIEAACCAGDRVSTRTRSPISVEGRQAALVDGVADGRMGAAGKGGQTVSSTRSKIRSGTTAEEMAAVDWL